MSDLLGKYLISTLTIILKNTRSIKIIIIFTFYLIFQKRQLFW